jgi:ABC-type microcin C transport system duplicated ATPase subunit YejF
LLTPTSGRIKVDGTDIARLSERAMRPFRSRIQMVFQDPYGSLDPHLTAVDIVAEPLRLQGIRNKRERQKRAAALIDRVGLPSTALNRRPGEFSGGQRQRIGIARALTSEPELLVCDEATSALDVSVQAQVLELLREIKRDTGLTYVFISHNLGVVREISDTIVVMSAGKIVERGATADVLARPAEPYTQALRAAALDPRTMVGVKPRRVLKGVA